MGVGQPAAQPVQLFFREEAKIEGEQCFQEAFGCKAQGLGVAGLLASSNLALSGPNWLKVGVPFWPD